MFIFWFNVLQYLNNPSQSISQLCRPKDIVMHSTWSCHLDANLHMRSYFSEIYRDTGCCYEKAISSVRDKNSQDNLDKIFAYFDHKQTFENNINKCDIYFL